MRLAICLATRGRPDRLIHTVETTLPNLRSVNPIFSILVDEDDAPTIKALEGKRKDWAGKVHPFIREREDTLGAKYNRMMGAADVYFVMVDYAPILTPGFDQMVLDKAALFVDRIGVVSGPLANLSFPCTQAVTHSMAALMGGIYPERFPFHYLDHWLDDVARMIGRSIRVELEQDCDTYRPTTTHGLREVSFWSTYYDVCAPIRHDQADRLLENMHIPVWQREMFKAGYPIVDQRSRMLHQAARAQAPHIEFARGDKEAPWDGYMRARERALAEMRRLVGDERAVA